MAQKEIVNVVTIKTEQSQNTIKGLKKEIADLKKNLESAEIGSDKFTQASKDLAKAQADLKTIMADGKKTTDNVEGSYNHLVATMAELKKEWRATADEVKRNEIGQQIDVINTQLKELDGSIGNFQRNVGDYANAIKDAFEEQQKSTENVRRGLDGLQKTASGLASGYAAVQGAMNLLNIENSNFEKAMIKVQSAMAIAQGVGGMKDLIEGAGTLKVGLQAAITGVRGFIASLNGVKAAIVSTGIGALVVAVGTLVAYWDDLMGFIKQDEEKIKGLRDDFENLKASMTAKDEDFEFFIKLQEAAGKSREEILKLHKENAYLKKETAHNEYLKIYIKLMDHLNNSTAWGNLTGGKKVREELEAQLEEAKKIWKQAEADYNKVIQQITEFEVKEKKDSLDEANAINERARQSLIDTKEEELAELKRIYEQEKALLIQQGIDITLLTEEYLKKKKEIEDKYGGNFQRIEQGGVLDEIKDKYNIEVELFRSSREQMLTIDEELHKKMLDEITAFSQKETERIREEAEKQKAIKEMVTQSSLSIASDALGSLSTIIGEETAVGKAAAVAQTTIDTYQSATAAYKSMAGIPVVGPALGIAAATAAALAGAANIKKILAVKTDGIGSGNVDTTMPSTPRVNLSESMPVQYTRDLLTDSELSNINQEQKVYVTENDISSTQNRVKVTENNASF